MPDCKLIRFNKVPPGGFRFTARAGEVTKRLRFDSMEQCANTLLSFRRDNALERATYDECVDDISLETCKEFGCDPRFCTDGSRRRPSAAVVKSNKGGCSFCGRKKRR